MRFVCVVSSLSPTLYRRIFSARLTLLERAIAKGRSVRLSICTSVTLVPYDKGIFYCLEAKFHSLEFSGSPQTSVFKRGGAPCQKQKCEQ